MGTTGEQGLQCDASSGTPPELQAEPLRQGWASVCMISKRLEARESRIGPSRSESPWQVTLAEFELGP